MLPPVTTRQLQAAIESKRRADAAERWRRVLRNERAPSVAARRDIPVARPHQR
jgi:hypothetical protein